MEYKFLKTLGNAEGMFHIAPSASNGKRMNTRQGSLLHVSDARKFNIRIQGRQKNT